MLLELLLGIGIGTLLFVSGMPSIIPLLIWLPALQEGISFPFLLGLCIAGVVQLARADESHAHFFPVNAMIAIAVGLVGILFLPLLEDFFPLLESSISLVVGAGMLVLLFFSSRGIVMSMLALLVVLSVGWQTLHVWVIPLALPALLFGLFGFSLDSIKVPRPLEANAWVESGLGIFLGMVPGLGPGLVALCWSNHYFSPALGIANLVFSLGMAVVFGRVRSASSVLLVGAQWSAWELVAWIGIGCVLAWGVHSMLNKNVIFISSEKWVSFHIIGLALLGSVSTLVVAGIGFCVFRFFKENNIPVQWGLACLVAPIWWFYFQ